MVRRSTWILLILFAVLALFTWLFQRNKDNKATNLATATPTIAPLKLYDLGDADINQISISDSAGEKMTLYRDVTSLNWAIMDLPAGQVDAAKIESLRDQLVVLPIKETLSETPPLDSIGLDTPQYTITMTSTNELQVTTYVGIQIPTGSGYYVQVDKGNVVIVDNMVISEFLDMLKNPPLLPTATPEVTPTETITPVEQRVNETPTP